MSTRAITARSNRLGNWAPPARRLFSLELGFDPWVWVLGLVCGTVLVGVSGTLATRRVVNTPPIVTLRDQAQS